MIGLIMGLVLLSYFIGSKLQNIISGPILDLANATQKISKDADYSFRVQKKGGDEVGALYDGFNNMLEQIHIREIEREKAQVELQKYQEHLEELVKERTTELEEKNKKLEEFNELFVNREFRIKELKDKVKELEKKNDG